MPLQAWGSFFWEVWGLVLPCNPPLNPGRFDGPLGHALSPMAMEDVDAHVGPPSCLGCEAAAFSVAPASRTWGWASAPSSSALHIRLKAQGGSLSGKACGGGGDTPPTSLPPPLALPQERAPATSFGAAGSGQKSRLRAARPPAQVPNRPPGQSDLEAQEGETGTTSVTTGQGPWEEGSLGTVRGGHVATEAYRGRSLRGRGQVVKAAKLTRHF